MVRIEGIGAIRGFANGRDATFVHCLELVLEAMGTRVDYDELMGVSGLAFRTQFRIDRWDPGNPDPLVGADCLPTLFAAIGWGYEVWVVRRDELAEADALRRSIRQSIDAGAPVLAANLIPPEDWGIITGYRRDGAWLCRAYNGGAERSDKTATGWPTAVVFLTRPTGKSNAPQRHKDSLRRAVEMQDVKIHDSYALGAQAFEEWRRSLRSVRDAQYVHANFWTYIGLIDARAAAVRYLRSIAEEFGPQKIYVSEAADWYDKEVRLLLDGLNDVPSERLYRDSIPPVETRARQIDTLGQAQSMEQSAVSALRKAV